MSYEDLVLQIGRSSLTFPRGLIMHSHNLGVILQSVCSLFWAETGRRLQENFERRSGNKFKPSGAEQKGFCTQVLPKNLLPVSVGDTVEQGHSATGVAHRLLHVIQLAGRPSWLCLLLD